MKIYIDLDRCKGVKQIWLFDNNTSYHIEKGKLVATESRSDTCEPIDRTPFLEMPISFADDFIEALVNMAHDAGVRTKSDDHRDGKIEAMKLHLADMREYFHKHAKLNDNA